MGVTVAVTRVACNTDTGNQDITTADLGGLTPKAALFIVTHAVTDGVAADHYVFSIGAATATDERWTMSGQAEHGQASSDADRIGTNDACIYFLEAGQRDTKDGEADFVTFIENGVRINWSNAPAAAYLMIVMLIAGTDLSAKAEVIDPADAQDGTVNVETIGFEADVVLTGCPGRALDDVGGLGAYVNLGVVINGASLSQYCSYFLSADGAANGDPHSHISNLYASGQLTTAGGILWAAEFSDLDALGFTCTTRLGNAGSDKFGVLCLAFGGAVDFWGAIIDTPTSTGNQSQTGPGFKPQFVMCGLTQMPAINTDYTDANAGSLGLSVFDADDEYCSSVQDEDAAATTDTQSLSDDTAVNLPDDDGTAAHVAAFVSFDANGWTWNFTATEGTAVKYWALAIEEVTAALSVNLSDAISVAETIEFDALSIAVSITDTVSVAESTPTRTLSFVSASENIATSESVADSLLAFPTASDSVSIAESVTARSILSADVSDGVTVTEAIGEALLVAIDISDSVSLSEDIAATLLVAIDISDGVSLSESATATLSTLIAATSDSVIVAENVSVSFPSTLLAIDLSDAVSVAEAAACFVILPVNTSEAVALSDNVTIASPELFASTSDNITTTEAVQFTLSALTTSISDSVAVTESVSAAIGVTVLLLNVSSGVALSDSAAIAIPWLPVAISDNITVSEVVQFELSTLTASISDSIAVSESVNGVIAFAALLLDVSSGIAISEAITLAALPISAVSTDSISLSEYVTTTVTALSPAVSDGVSLADSASTALLITSAVSDSVAVAENVTTVTTLGILAVSDAVTATDIADARLLVAPVTSDSVAVAESVARILYCHAVTEDGITATEAVTFTNSTCYGVTSDTVTVAEATSIFRIGLVDVTLTDTAAYVLSLSDTVATRTASIDSLVWDVVMTDASRT